MARGARSHRLAINRNKLRDTVFEPKHYQSLERLNAKLELIKNSKAPTPPPQSEEKESNALEVEDDDVIQSNQIESMDIDQKHPPKKQFKPKTKKEKRLERKLKKKKVKNMITFPVKTQSKRREPRI